MIYRYSSMQTPRRAPFVTMSLRFVSFIAFLFLVSMRSHFSMPESRDGNLNLLVHILNGNATVFKNWKGSLADYEAFMSMLEPWIVAPPSVSLNTSMADSNPVRLNCADMKYAGVLTGKELSGKAQHRMIVDFVPFGYDVDKLELRLHETYEYLDAIVIYEAPRTQYGLVKQLFLPKLLRDARFLPFADKIIHLEATLDELRAAKEETDAGLRRTNLAKQPSVKSGAWALENSMRSMMMKKFTQLNDETHPVKKKIFDAMALASANAASKGHENLMPLGLQNDADELATGTSLLHLRRCEIKREVKGIYLPSFSFKKNFHWLQATMDTHLEGPSFSAEPNNNASILVQMYMWRPAPYAWPLDVLVKAQTTLRGEWKPDKFWEKHHMGIGSGYHISSVAEPVEYWMKRGGVIEQREGPPSLPKAIIRAGQTSSFTPELIFRHTIHPWCPQGAHGVSTYESMHVHSLSQEAQSFVYSSLPRLVREQPDRYPFLLPGPFFSREGSAKEAAARNTSITGLFHECGKAEWVNLCLQRSTGMRV